MSNIVVHGVFNSHADAGEAIPALKNAGLSASKFSVIGVDGDAFRAATASLHSMRVPKIMFALGLSGAIAGCLAGFWGMPRIPDGSSMFLMMVPLSAAFVGTAIGLFTGMWIGGILILDDAPPTEAEVRLGDVRDGDVSVSINVADTAQRDLAQQLMWQFGAVHVAVDSIPDAEAQVDLAPAGETKGRTIEAARMFQKTA